MKKNHLVFIDNRIQVLWIKETKFYDPSMIFVALTADALQILEELGYSCHSISNITSTTSLVLEEDNYIKELLSLVKEIEIYIAQRYQPAQYEGPGFLSENYYYLQYSISAIARRAYLMREAIIFFSPSHVTAFNGMVNDWFIDDGYNANPWDEILELFSKEYNFLINFIRIPTLKGEENVINPDIIPFSKRLLLFIKWRIKDIFNRITEFPEIFFKTNTLSEEFNNLRLLFVNSIGYDWGPTLKLLQKNKKIISFQLKQIRLKKDQWWSTICNSSIEELFSDKKYMLNLKHPIYNEQESRELERLFTLWLNEHQEPPTLFVLGINLFPYLILQIKSMIIFGPDLIAYCDKLANCVLEKTNPDVVCFSNITLLYERRFAYQCEKKHIPTVVYTHGFGDNLWIQPKNEGCDQGCADYVIQYGPGIKPRSNTVFPIKSTFVSLGSARIEEMIKTSQYKNIEKEKKINLLWIAETTTQNTHEATVREDTRRYMLQKGCISTLLENNQNYIIYRPLQSQLYKDGTSSWIKFINSSSVSIDITTPLEELILKSDVVILDISSMTTWGEVIGLKKPMILYCNLLETPMAQYFISDLEKACHWCKNEEDFNIALRRLVDDPHTFINELKKIDNSLFIKKYILADGNCAMNVCSFLNSLRRDN